MKDHLLSTTSVEAMLAFWKQQKIRVPAKANNCMLEVRLLTSLEKKDLKLQYAGNPALPWFGFFLNGQMKAAHDSLPRLLVRLRKANYRIIDYAQLG